MVIVSRNKAIAAAYEEEFQQVYQAAGGQPSAVASPPPTEEEVPTPSTSSPPVEEEEEPDHRININTATGEELKSLPGIGEKLAQRIIEERPYEKVEDLLRVEGIGAGKLEQIREQVRVQ